MTPKAFRIILVVTGLAVLGAALAVGMREEPLQSASSGVAAEEKLVFPGLLDRLNDVRSLIVRHVGGQLTLEQKDGHWGLAEREGYPARGDKVRDALLAMAQLRLVEPKTAKPERYADLHLGAPEDKDSRGREVLLLDGGGALMAGVIVGKQKPELGAGGGVYLRLSGEEQAWLARGVLDPGTQPQDWLEPVVLDIARDRVTSVSVSHADGGAVVVRRAAKEDKEFVLEGLGVKDKAEKLRSPALLDAMARVVTDLQLTEVARIEEGVDRGKPDLVATVVTFDGLTLTLTLYRKGEEDWLLAAASGGSGDEATSLGARLSGWTFRIPSYKAASLRKRREDLVQGADAGNIGNK